MIWLYLFVYVVVIFFFTEVSLIREKSGADFLREAIAILLWPLVLVFAIVALIVVLVSMFIYREEKDVGDD